LRWRFRLRLLQVQPEIRRETLRATMGVFKTTG
jgi:hypothetical protein